MDMALKGGKMMAQGKISAKQKELQAYMSILFIKRLNRSPILDQRYDHIPITRCAKLLHKDHIPVKDPRLQNNPS